MQTIGQQPGSTLRLARELCCCNSSTQQDRQEHHKARRQVSWLHLDDQFADHPKIAQAGGDAAWLFVCVLLYCKRFDTEGFVPAAQVPRLTDRKQPTRLVTKLIAVELLHETDGGYLVHDWSDWNRSSQSRSEAGRKAAAARWDKRNANRNANASDSHDDRIQKGDASGCTIPIPNPLLTSVEMVTKEQPQPVETVDNQTSTRVRQIIQDTAPTKAAARAAQTRATTELPQLLQQFNAPAELLAAVLLGQPAQNLANYRRNPTS